MSGLVEALKSLAAAFAQLGVRWYVFGAQAAILHGAARATADIDVTVDLAEQTTEVLATALRAQGFALRFTDDAFVAQTRVLPVTHSSGVPVDVVLSGPGLEELFFEGVVFRTVGGARVPVASAEDIIVMKVLAARAKDLDDVRAVVSAKGGTLDVARIRATLALLEEALDQSSDPVQGTLKRPQSARPAMPTTKTGRTAEAIITRCARSAFDEEATERRRGSQRHRRARGPGCLRRPRDAQDSLRIRYRRRPHRIGPSRHRL